MSSHIAHQFSVYSRPQRIIKIHLAVFDVISVCFTILFSLFQRVDRSKNDIAVVDLFASRT